MLATVKFWLSAYHPIGCQVDSVKLEKKDSSISSDSVDLPEPDESCQSHSIRERSEWSYTCFGFLCTLYSQLNIFGRPVCTLVIHKAFEISKSYGESGHFGTGLKHCCRPSAYRIILTDDSSVASSWHGWELGRRQRWRSRIKRRSSIDEITGEIQAGAAASAKGSCLAVQMGFIREGMKRTT